MSGVIGQFAEDLSDAASAVGNVNTDGITGGFGATLGEQKASLVGVLEDFSAALTQLQEVADEHRRSEATFVATAPTLAEIAEAEKALLDLQAAGPSITSGTSVVPTLMGITDLAYMQAVENAQRRFTQLSQERRDAMRIFIDAQNRLSERINGTDIPSSIERTSRERGSGGSLGPSPSGADSSVIPGGFTSPGVRSPNAGAVGRGEASDSSSPSGGGDAQRPSTQDVLAAGTPVSEMGAAPMVVPQAGMGNPGMIPGRFGPQVAPDMCFPGPQPARAR
ncbi:hypothetical protein GS531_22910 [Rhodococcus hoagii]|nr:hypothetical protein [Prescottella equi]